MSKTAANAWIGAAMRFVRFERGVSQSDLATKFSIPQATVSKYESGKAIIPATYLIAFCKHFGITVELLDQVADKGREMAQEIEDPAGAIA